MKNFVVAQSAAQWIAQIMLVLLVALPSRGINAQSAGAIDTSFGTSGVAVNTTVTGDVTDIVGFPDGKVLGVGSCTTGFGAGTCLYRWTSAGVADTSFGINGVSYLIAATVYSPRLLLRPDGRIVVSAICGTFPNTQLCVAQSNPNGTAFDASFGTGGNVALAAPNVNGITRIVFSPGMALQPDGRLLVGATCPSTSGQTNVCVARLLSNGTLDTSFGSSPHFWSTNAPGGGLVELTKLTLQADGRYLVSATCEGASTNNATCVSRFFGNGGLQSSFTIDIPSRKNYPIDVRILGNFVTLSGFTTDASYADFRLFAARRELYAPFGGVDASYGGTYPTAGIGTLVNIDSSNDGSSLRSRIMSDGGVVYAGRCNNSPLLCLARFAANGTLDSSFGVAGRYEYAGYTYPGSTSESTVAEAADGKILLGGTCAGSRPCVYRFNDIVQSAPKCSLDIDGDGVINATTDGLILLRAMLGISGANALANAVGTGASRSTWPQVREYLFDQCRMPVL